MSTGEHSIARVASPSGWRARAEGLPTAWLGVPFSQMALFAFMASLAFERGGAGLRDALLWVSFALLAWERRADWLELPGGRWDLAGWARRFALWLAWGAVLALAAAGLTSVVQFTFSGGARAIAMEALERLPPLCIAAPVLVRLVRVELSGTPPAGRLARWTMGCVALWAAWMTASCTWSLDPEASFFMLYAEGGTYLVVFTMIWLTLAHGAHGTRGGEAGRGDAAATVLNWTTALALFGAAVALAVVALAAAGWLGSRGLVLRLAELDLLRVNWSEYGGRVVRVQFPFREHNRLASWLLTALALAPVAMALTPSGWRGPGAWRRWALAGAMVLVIAAVVFTGTRGAMVAVAAMLGVLALGRPRVLLAAVPLALVALAVLPGSMREHIGTLTNPETYRNPAGSILYRMVAYRNTATMIADHPLLGIGYGWPVYEQLYPTYDPEGADIERKPHAHNNVLEITAETGVVGGALYLALQVLLALGALRLIARGPTREARALGWALLAALTVVNVFGLTNYNLRRTVGYWVWGVFAVTAVLARQSQGEAPTGN